MLVTVLKNKRRGQIGASRDVYHFGRSARVRRSNSKNAPIALTQLVLTEVL